MSIADSAHHVRLSDLARVWQPGQLRWFQPQWHPDDNHGSPGPLRLRLQQEWVNALGEREWRDVPLFLEGSGWVDENGTD